MLTTWNKLPRRIGQISAALLLALVAAQNSNAQLPQPGKPVSLYLTAEENGDLVKGLTQQDFRLFEDGQPRQFKLEKPQTPISVAVLLENSQRAENWYWEDIQSAVQGFLDNAQKGNWYALASFAHKLHIEVDFTQSIGKIQQGLGDIQAPLWSDIDTYDAVYEMLTKMAPIEGRKALIFVGSGYDTGFSGHTLEDVLKEAESVNVTIYSVAADASLRGYYNQYLGNMAQLNLEATRAFLQGLAEKSGGQAWFPMEQGAYPDIMKGIMQSLDAQYRLVYTPEAPTGKFDKIKVEAFAVVNDQRKDFHVRVREGWLFK
jgi:VWFA-related protein